MALQGTLDTFALPDVLRLLATTAKTGCLNVNGDRGKGSVWLRDGTVMATAADRAIADAPSEEVLFELLRFEEGEFAFDVDEVSPHGEQPEDVEVLLRDANALLGEWRELEAVVPSLEHRVTLVKALSGKDVTIDADHWPSLVAIGAGCSVRDLGSTLGLGELGVTRAVRDLVELGVVTIDEPHGDVPPPPRTEDVPPPDGLRSGRPAARPSTPRLDAPPRSERPERSERPDRAERPERSEPGRGPSRRGPFAGLSSGETLGLGERDDATTTAEMQRLGWLQSPERTSGPQAGVTPDGGTNGADGDQAPAGPNGSSTPVAGRSSARLTGGREPKRASGRSGASSTKRSGSANGRSASAKRSAPPAGDDATTIGPLSPPNGTPTTSRPGKGRSGSRRSGSSRSSAASAGGMASPSGPAFDAGAPPPRSFDTGGTMVPPAYEAGPLGPPPLPADTGQIRPVSPSALPPDLHWAADDAPRGGRGNGVGNGLGGLGLGGPAVPPVPIDPSKVAPHVAAMSPEARAAVQGTVGNAGGATGGQAVGDDLADRGQLLNFLSSVRP